MRNESSSQSMATATWVALQDVGGRAYGATFEISDDLISGKGGKS